MSQAIDIDSVTKTYRIGVGRARGREMLPYPLNRAVARAFPNWWARNTFNALEDVSLSVDAGGSLGLIGHNGAGKTTLLKVIAGVTAPTKGRIMLGGRIAALIDVIVGFHPDLTGRENCYLLGAVYGFNRKEMSSRLDRILDFAEIREMADTPLKRFSAGMMARLGFGIVSSLDVEILLIDEVLAVGDASFQRKCVEWLQDYQRNAGTLVFVSHNLALVRSMTQSVAWLDKGRVVEQGATGDVLARYAKAMEQRREDPALYRSRAKTQKAMVARGLHRWGAGGAWVEAVHIDEPAGREGPIQVVISYSATDVDRGVVCIGFLDEAGREIGVTTSAPVSLNDGGALNCSIDSRVLREGIYFPVVAILTPDGQIRDKWRLDRAIVIEANGEVALDDFGSVNIPAEWRSGTNVGTSIS
jgi:ABC-type polysaccharide/polyol phosphate transport system ATPase subunit